VPIYGYRCDEFPAFWRRRAGLKLDQRFDELEPLARAIREHQALGHRARASWWRTRFPRRDEVDERPTTARWRARSQRVKKQGIRGAA
jgi:pseudouridine-5'-phosphate glycosidase